MQKHKKHEDLARPAYGTFARHEWAFVGTDCSAIRQLAFRLCEAFQQRWKLAYVDADHPAADAEKTAGRDEKSALAHGAQLDFTDKITFHRFDSQENFGPFQYRLQFNGMDAVLVNGNHFNAKNQVVIVDEAKRDSLLRKLDRLNHVQLILLKNDTQPFDFLQENVMGFEKIPVLHLSDYHSIQDFFEKKLTAAVPPLCGLVLAGGKSRRMGTDKSVLQYHDKPQRDRMLDLLEPLCEQTYLSCRPEQAGELMFTHDVLPDTFLSLGPMGALLSAFRQLPDSAWLVVACDLPLLDENSLRFLIENRNPSAVATAFKSPDTGLPEPLVAIWEPRSYPVLLQFLAQGYSCPRKVLINSLVHLLEAPKPEALLNVNTPEEVEVVLKKLGVEGF